MFETENAQKTIKEIKKTKGILRIVFSRTAVIVLSLILQLFVLLATFHWLSEYSAILNGLFIAMGAATVVYILNEETNSSFKMVWMIPVLVVPVFGTLMFIFVNLQLETKFMRKRLNLIERELSTHLIQEQAIVDKMRSEDNNSGEAGLINYLNNAGNFPTYDCNSVKYFPLGEDKFA
ncbi:MAG: PLD nuclease N-terminal domain-containing protein, partial [Eubacteriales bacterium]|nr:PLD nuclease N-terminal domain-containing protein [Eubacteriales bacterium]